MSTNPEPFLVMENHRMHLHYNFFRAYDALWDCYKNANQLQRQELLKKMLINILHDLKDLEEQQ